MTREVLEAVVQFIPWMKNNWKIVLPIMPRAKIFHVSDLAIEKPWRLMKSIIIKINEAKNKRIPLNPKGENSRSAILTKEKFTAQSNTAKSIKKSVVPNFLGSSI